MEKQALRLSFKLEGYPDPINVDQGKPGPKDNPKGDSDGKRLKIPAPAANGSDVAAGAHAG